MKYPSLLLLPVFMFVDYFLTVAGAVLKERKYDEHFKTEHYELNPLWQKEIARKRWFNPRHILLTITISSLVILLMEFADLPVAYVQAFSGCLFTVFAAVIGRHLSNLLTFRAVMRKPNEVSGEVTVSHSMLLSIAMYQYLVVVVPIVIIAVFSPNPFVLGALGGAILMLSVHLGWARQHRKQKVSREVAQG